MEEMIQAGKREINDLIDIEYIHESGKGILTNDNILPNTQHISIGPRPASQSIIVSESATRSISRKEDQPNSLNGYELAMVTTAKNTHVEPYPSNQETIPQIRIHVSMCSVGWGLG